MASAVRATLLNLQCSRTVIVQCLCFSAVHKRQHFIIEDFSKQVSWSSVCHERFHLYK